MSLNSTTAGAQTKSNKSLWTELFFFPSKCERVQCYSDLKAGSATQPGEESHSL